MMRAIAFASSLAIGGAVSAQEQVEKGSGAVLRALDKLNGTVADVSLDAGGVADIGFVSVRMDECRYPVGNPAGNAYAFVTIRDDQATEPLFQGWMIASAPALNALDHPRYDVWVLRCKT